MHDIDRTQLEMTPEMEGYEFEQFEAEQFGMGETGAVFNEVEEMELASELLGVSNEQELDRFLGDLIKKVGHAVGQVVRSPIGQPPAFPRRQCAARDAQA